MESVVKELTNLLFFTLEFLSLFVPCTIGTLLGVYFSRTIKKADAEQKHLKLSRQKKPSLGRDIIFAMSSSIVPTLIILMALHVFPALQNIHFVLKYASPILIGFIGSEKVTRFFMNTSNVFKVIKALLGGKAGIIELAQEFSNEDSEDPTDEYIEE